MRLRRVATVNALLLNEIRLPAGRYAGILLDYHGTAQALQTVTLADLGYLFHRFRSRPIGNVRAAELWVYDDLRGGRPAGVSAAGGAWRFVVIFPYRYGPLNTWNSDDNLLNVRPNEGYVRNDPVNPITALTAEMDICLLEDVGAARYIPGIFDQIHTYTGADRFDLSAPNLRHVLLENPSGVGTLPSSVLLTRDSRVIIEGSWQQLTDLTDLDSMIEVGAAATGYIMPDLGNRNPATWAGGKFELGAIGAAAGDQSHVVEFGAEPISAQEFIAVNQIEINDMAQQMATSPLPPAAMTAPLVNVQIQMPGQNVLPVPQVPPSRETIAQDQARQAPGGTYLRRTATVSRRLRHRQLVA